MNKVSVPEGYQRVAIAGGTGELGCYISEEFLKHEDIKLRILSRKINGEDKKKDLKDKFIKEGAEIVDVDYTNQESLNSALKDIDVVIVTIGDLELEKGSVGLIEASKVNNIKLFIPSEFATDVDGVDSLLTTPKNNVKKYLKQSGLNYIFYNNGFFMEHLLADFYGIDIKQHTAEIVGTGDVELKVTSLKDVAKFIARTYFLEQVRNQSVDFYGESTTLNRILKTISEVSNKSFKVEYISFDEADKRTPKDSDFYSSISYLIRKFIEQGFLNFKGNSNHLVPGLEFISIKQYVKDTYYK